MSWNVPSRQVDLRFVVDATAETGFGHIMRCLELTKMTNAARPGTEILFQGRFAESARGWIADILGPGQVCAPDIDCRASVSVIDRMADPVDINIWDEALAAEIAKGSRSTIAIFSGDRPPAKRRGTIGIGYQPVDEAVSTEGWLWSLDFAPVSSRFMALSSDAQSISPQSGRLLIAMGASPEPAGIASVIEAVLACDAVDAIDVLVSPLQAGRAQLRDVFATPRITWLSGVEDIRPLMLNAAAIVTSYGNLGFEALALGRPVCFLAYKLFQERMAQRLAQRGAAVNAGLVGTATAASFTAALSQTFGMAGQLSENARRLVDGRGLDRIHDVIARELAGV